MADEPATGPYSSEAVDSLTQGHLEVDADIEQLAVRVAQNGQHLASVRAKEFLLHGVGRRLRVLRRGLKNVFALFPPSATQPIDPDDLENAQLSLHAFVINLYGLFDNLAWAFVWRHGLEKVVDKRQVGMFKEGTKQHLPQALHAYLDSEKMMRWSTEYLKNYRDSLAHRIPLYIPPAGYSEEETARSAAIDQEQLECILNQDWRKLEALRVEQRRLGAAWPVFVHSFEEDSTPLVLHPQMLSDAKTVIEACNLFLEHWHERHPA